MENKRILCIIPARSGSNGIPNYIDSIKRKNKIDYYKYI